MRKQDLSTYLGLLMVAVVSGCTLGATDEGGSSCPPDEEAFEQKVLTPVLSGRCASCHSAAGIAKNTGFVLDAKDVTASLDAAVAMAKKKVDGTPVLLAKPTGGTSHGGGALVAVSSAEYKTLESFVDQVLGTPGACDAR